MGIHLDNIILSRTSDHELLSTAVTMGLVQLTHEGRLIILMQDCQTTGGYPGVNQIIKSDLPVLAQLKPGSVIRLKMITFDLAKSIEIDRQNKIRDLYGSEL
jgi:antagonist of KipI